jgi:hypothetical protein
VGFIASTIVFQLFYVAIAGLKKMGVKSYHLNFHKQKA